MIPLYILGLLQRYGPQHGYQIKKIIAEQLSDFTQIKLPTIYYHLDKMAAEGLLSANSEKPGGRPEKVVYAVTERGLEAFQAKLSALLDFDYRPMFPSDGVFYFGEHLNTSNILLQLERYIGKLDSTINQVRKHKAEMLAFIPEEMRTYAEIIFLHHENHYEAEINWAQESLKRLKRKEF